MILLLWRRNIMASNKKLTRVSINLPISLIEEVKKIAEDKNLPITQTYILLLNNAIQNADVTFSMWDEHDVLRISCGQCNIVLVDQDTCDERYVIEYAWKKRDTKRPGQYKGRFTITFKDDIYQEGMQFDGGDLIMPIHEDLEIFIK